MKYYEAKDQNIRLFYAFLSTLRIINILKKTDVKSYNSRVTLVESIQTLRSFRHISNLTKLKLFTLRLSQSLNIYCCTYLKTLFCSPEPRL